MLRYLADDLNNVKMEADMPATPTGAPAEATTSTAKEGFHHGSLHEALVAAADAVLTERGVEGFTLREAARRAGVSPAAPAHHFGSATGLLTEVAIRGFEELGHRL